MAHIKNETKTIQLLVFFNLHTMDLSFNSIFGKIKELHNARKQYIEHTLQTEKACEVKTTQTQDPIFNEHNSVILYDDLIALQPCLPEEHLSAANIFKLIGISVVEFTENPENIDAISLFEPLPIYTYHCIKNNWRFCIILHNEYITGVRSLSIDKLQCIKDNTLVNCHYNVYTDTTILIDLLSTTYEEFIENKYGSFLRLKDELNVRYPQEVTAKGLDSVRSNKIGEKQIELPLSHYIKVKNVHIQWAPDGRLTLTQDSEKLISDTAREIIYNGIDELCKHIESYNDEITGNYGFTENNVKYNDKHLLQWVTSFAKQMETNNYDLWNYYEGHMNWSTKNMSVYDGRMIDFKLTFSFGTYLPSSYLCERMDFDTDEHTIIFTYDINKDPNNCHLLISCTKINCTENTKEPIVEKLCLKGTFTSMFDKMKTFITTIYRIHEFSIK